MYATIATHDVEKEWRVGKRVAKVIQLARDLHSGDGARKIVSWTRPHGEDAVMIKRKGLK